MSDLLPAQKCQKNAVNESASLVSLLSDDLLDKCFAFVGQGYYRCVGGTCRRFRDVYVNERDRTTETFWRHVSERVPCAELCLEDQEWLERSTEEKKQVINKIGSKSILLGKVKVLAWAHGNGFQPWSYHFVGVGKSGHVNVLEWAHENEADWSSHKLIEAAVMKGQVPVLDFVYGKEPSAFNYDSFDCWTGQCGHIRVLEWIKQKDLFPTIDEGKCIMRSAAICGHVHVLDWLCEYGYLLDYELVDAAAAGGHIGVLEWARDRGIRGSTKACANAAVNGNLDALQWLRENYCRWDGRVIAWAERRGHDDIVEWARENGCPEPEHGNRFQV